MPELIVWGAVVVVLAAILDRLLLLLEKRGWIFYRRTKGRGGGAVYHVLEMHSVFDPGMEQIQEIRVEDERHQDESGDPPAPDEPDDSRPSERPGPAEGEPLKGGAS